jgi:hypothetical protein
MEIKLPYRVECLNCGAKVLIDMELECVGSYERKMGLELEHLAAFDGVCPECERDIFIQVEVWEYPEGNIEDYGVVTKGAKEVEKLELNKIAARWPAKAVA